MEVAFEFERPVSELENQIKELRDVQGSVDISRELRTLQGKVSHLLEEIYCNLKPWERVQLARHPNRPHTVHFIEKMVEDFHEISGDRYFYNDEALITGFGRINGRKVAIIGIEKGLKTKEKVQRNFGMPRPEGYRKALRLMKLAARFGLPVVSFVDTPGAFPGIDAEERGQAEAIANNLAEMFDIRTPMIAVIIGEGGSGGALGIAITDRVYMMEYSVYSVISPESCASILWSDPKKAEIAANALQLGPQKALELKIIDDIIKEPVGGAHRNHDEAVANVRETVVRALDELAGTEIEVLLKSRFNRYRQMGNATLTGGQGLFEGAEVGSAETRIV